MDKSNKKNEAIGQVQIASMGTIKDKKSVAPQMINYNKQSGRINIHLNDRDIISIPPKDLLENQSIRLKHSPGSRETIVEKTIKPNAAVAMRITGETETVRFVRPTSINFDLVRNALDVNLDKDHKVEISNSRMKSMGLEFEFVQKQKSMER